MIRNKSIYLYTLNIIIITLSTFIGIYIYRSNNHLAGYETLYLLPFTFAIAFLFLLSRPLIMSKSIFLWVFTVFAVLRYLILPFFITYEKYYTGFAIYPPSPNSVEIGILLMIYEMLISSVFISFLYKILIVNTKKKLEITKIKGPKLLSNKLVYIIIIAFSTVIALINPEILGGISFFTIINRLEKASLSAVDLFFRQLLIMSKLLLYFLLIDKFQKKYTTTKNVRYLWFSYLISIFNIVIYIGANRKQILMNAIATILTINFLYPKYKKRTTIVILSLAIYMFIQMTIIRFYSNSSYAVFEDLAGTLQVYLSGPYNMAIAVETNSLFIEEISGFNIIYDIMRPFYGIGSYFKQFSTLLSTEYFNRRISIGGTFIRTDQIMPITGQGLLHFNYLLSPLYLLVTIYLGFCTESKLKQTQDFSKRYILITFTVLLGQVMGINMTIIVNYITFNGILFYVIHWLNSKVVLR